MNGDGDARSNGQATVEDEEDEVAMGPEMPDDLEDEVNDEEGRFFGGGITNNTAEVLDFIDEKDQGDQLVRRQDSNHILHTKDRYRNQRTSTRLGCGSWR